MTTPQILVTQPSQATVELTAADPPVVEVTAPAVPATIELNVPGPQGPEGPVALPAAIRIDASTAGAVYVGRAANGTSDSAADWTITRSLFNAAGIRINKGQATAVAWTARTSATYS